MLYRFKTNTHDNTNFTVRLDLWCFESLDRMTKFANMRQRGAETNRLYRTIVDYSPSRDHTRSRRLFAPLKIHLEALTHLSAIHSFNYAMDLSIPLNRFERYQYRKIISDNFVGLCLDFLLNNFLSISFFFYLNITRMNIYYSIPILKLI